MFAEMFLGISNLVQTHKHFLYSRFCCKYFSIYLLNVKKKKTPLGGSYLNIRYISILLMCNLKHKEIKTFDKDHPLLVLETSSHSIFLQSLYSYKPYHFQVSILHELKGYFVGFILLSSPSFHYHTRNIHSVVPRNSHFGNCS